MPDHNNGYHAAATPLVAQILHHRDDLDIAAKVKSFSADDQVLFPILVAVARLVAKADVQAPRSTRKVAGRAETSPRASKPPQRAKHGPASGPQDIGGGS